MSARKTFCIVALVATVGSSTGLLQAQSTQEKQNKVKPAASGASSVKGSGTSDRIAKWVDDKEIDDSEIVETGGNVAIGTTPSSSTKASGSALLDTDATVRALNPISAATSQGGTNGKDVNVVNTPDVNVVNTPAVQAQQSGAWNVSIAGMPSVQVGNTAQAPVLARDVDEPARQPFQRGGAIDFATDENRAFIEFTVPANKRLVIEYVSALIVMPNEKLFWFSVNTSAGNSSGHHFFVPIKLPDTPVPAYIVSQQTRLYANPGSTVTIEARRTGLTGDAVSGQAHVSGYLVDQ